MNSSWSFEPIELFLQRLDCRGKTDNYAQEVLSNLMYLIFSLEDNLAAHIIHVVRVYFKFAKILEFLP